VDVRASLKLSSFQVLDLGRDTILMLARLWLGARQPKVT
jgi:hypothetical protein